MYLSPGKFFRNQILLDYLGRWRNQSCQIFFQSVHSGVSGKGSNFAIFSANRRWPLQLLYYRTTVISLPGVSVLPRGESSMHWVLTIVSANNVFNAFKVVVVFVIVFFWFRLVKTFWSKIRDWLCLEINFYAKKIWTKNLPLRKQTPFTTRLKSRW